MNSYAYKNNSINSKEGNTKLIKTNKKRSNPEQEIS